MYLARMPYDRANRFDLNTNSARHLRATRSTFAPTILRLFCVFDLKWPSLGHALHYWFQTRPEMRKAARGAPKCDSRPNRSSTCTLRLVQWHAQHLGNHTAMCKHGMVQANLPSRRRSTSRPWRLRAEFAFPSLRNDAVTRDALCRNHCPLIHGYTCSEEV